MGSKSINKITQTNLIITKKYRNEGIKGNSDINIDLKTK